ncbi:hypothetical protein VKT23_008818 [Stygiomarasmius scandens]|uniref:Uncharacterized protein n=1 Tax=Marasmiellus scandens TaxID=2682957 RepID=A0ABR1JI13_9AGAR
MSSASTSVGDQKGHLRNRSSQFQFNPNPNLSRPTSSRTPSSYHSRTNSEAEKFTSFKFPRADFSTGTRRTQGSALGKPLYLPSPPPTPATETRDDQCCTNECAYCVVDENHIDVRYTSAFTSDRGSKDAYNTYSYPYGHDEHGPSDSFSSSVNSTPKTQTLQLVPMAGSDSVRSSLDVDSPHTSTSINSPWSLSYGYGIGFGHRVRQSISSLSIDFKGSLSLPTHFGLTKNPSGGHYVKLRAAGMRGGTGARTGFLSRFNVQMGMGMGRFGRLSALTLTVRTRLVSPSVVRALMMGSWIAMIGLLLLAMWFIVKGY